MSLFQGKMNSDYFAAYTQGKEVVVFVENEEDIIFWRNIFQNYSPGQNYRFSPSVRGNSERGKTGLLKIRDGVGKFLLLCMDSDFDYLLQSSGSTSREINQNPYLFQTYTYSVENYKCYSESLRELCIEASLNENIQFDFVSFLKEYSKILYELFLYCFYFVKEEKTDQFSLKQFAKETRFSFEGEINLQDNGKIILEKIKTQVEKKLQTLKESHPALPLESLKEKLLSLGVQPENAYLFIYSGACLV